MWLGGWNRQTQQQQLWENSYQAKAVTVLAHTWVVAAMMAAVTAAVPVAEPYHSQHHCPCSLHQQWVLQPCNHQAAVLVYGLHHTCPLVYGLNHTKRGSSMLQRKHFLNAWSRGQRFGLRCLRSRTCTHGLSCTLTLLSLKSHPPSPLCRFAWVTC